MSEPGSKLSPEELNRRLQTLSFEKRTDTISAGHRTLREQAAVRADFSLGELRTEDIGPPDAQEQALQVFLPELAVSNLSDGGSAWRLIHRIRRTPLEELVSSGRLQVVHSANPAGIRSTLQDMFDAYIRQEALSLADQSLDQLEATLQILDWLPSSYPGLPPIEDARRTMQRERQLKTFRFLAGEHFKGRIDELARLEAYLANDDRGAHERPLLIYGPGGIGKSTLIARFVLDHVDTIEALRLPFVFIDFNRRDINVEDPISILLEAARQLAIQFPLDEDRWRKLSEEWQSRSELRQPGPVTKQSSYDFESSVSARQREWRRYIAEFTSMLTSVVSDERPLLLILDTLEELLYHNREHLEMLWTFLQHTLVQQGSPLRLILSGRAPLPPEFETDEMLLKGLDRASAGDFLLEKGVSDPAFAEEIIDVVGTSPLSLWLASELFRRMGGKMEGFAELEERQEYFFRVKEYLIQGVLYRRILGHIHEKEDARLASLAHPGFVLRRINPDLLVNVLAVEAKLEIEGLEEARALLTRLKDEAWMIDMDHDNPDELRQRPELRLAMLELLRQDDPESVEAIHRRAATYFRNRIQRQRPPDPVDVADEVYHRLMLGEDPDFLDETPVEQLQPIADELGSHIGELPPGAQAYLASRARVNTELSEEIWARADLATWEERTARSVLRLLTLQQYERALERLGEREERSSSSPLYPLEVLALRGLHRDQEARALLAEGIRRTPPNTDEMRVLLLQSAEMDERAERFADAREDYLRVRHISERLRDPIGELSAQLGLLRMTESIYDYDAPEVTHARSELVTLWDEIDDQTLLENVSLIKDCATQVGAAEPEVVKRALGLVGLGATPPIDTTELALTLASWDDLRSAELEEETGVLARQVGAGSGSDLAEIWQNFLNQHEWNRVSFAILSLLDDHPLTPTVSITLLDLMGSRLLLSNEQAQTLQQTISTLMSDAEQDEMLQAEFEITLEEISSNRDGSGRVQDLLSWAEGSGQVVHLLQTLRQRYPTHEGLVSLFDSLGITAGGEEGGENQGSVPKGVGPDANASSPDPADTAAWRAGLRRAEVTVCRGELFRNNTPSYFSAFLVGPDLVMTVYYTVAPVIEEAIPPQALTFRFDIVTTRSSENLSQGRAYGLALGSRFETLHGFRPWLVAADPDLGFALLRLEQEAGNLLPSGVQTAMRRGWLSLAEEPNLSTTQTLSVIGISGGTRRTSRSEDQVYLGLSRDESRMLNAFELDPGSAGAPILDMDLNVVGIKEMGMVRSEEGVIPVGEALYVPAIVAYLESRGIRLQTES